MSRPSSLPQLVLASASAYRRELLDKLRVPYSAAAHLCDEDSVKTLGMDPDAVAVRLARLKAQSLRARFPDAWILGSDQILDLDGEILGKPGTRQRAIEQLGRLSGQTHELITAVCLLGPAGEVHARAEVHRMTMRTLSAASIERYIDADQPLDCCGSYKIESLGIALFESIEGSDFTAITGLPLMWVTQMLCEVGFDVP